jgi:hypothetical protein
MDVESCTNERTKRMECGAGPDHHGLLGIYTKQSTSHVIQGGTKYGRLARRVPVVGIKGG